MMTNHNARKYLLSATIMFFFLGKQTISSAQISFQELEKGFETDFHSGIAIGVCDMNGDHKDDLITLDKGNHLHLSYQRELNHYFKTQSMISNHGENTSFSLIAGDIDNDFINDIVLGFVDGADIYKNEIDSVTLVSTIPNIFIQGMNMVDFNQDQALDLFVCDDNAESRLYENVGNEFNYQPNWIDFSTTIVSDNSGNYGSEWIDFDSDGDLDLYVSKCRANVFTPTDPRRINMLFVNDGNWNFEEKAAEYGLAEGAQSWATNFGDVDNDGDLDAFMINHDDYFFFYENIDNDHFELKEDYIDQLLSGYAFQGVMSDVNNDAYLDIIISGEKDYLLINNGDLTFEVQEEITPIDEIHSFGLGDLNDDGFVDIYASFADGINEYTNNKDRILLNESNENHFVKITLTGTDSDINAIGSRIEIYGAWGKQIREVKSGESYGIMNSLNIHFGLGTNQQIDSIKVKWPNGDRHTFYDQSGDQHYFINQDGCLSLRQPLIIEGDITLCEGPVLLSTHLGTNHQWSSGETSASIAVSETGSYFCRYTNENGCLVWTESIDLGYMDNVTPTVYHGGVNVYCNGDVVILTTEEAENYFWSTGEESASIEVTTTGEYSVALYNSCFESNSETIALNFLNIDPVEITNDTVHSGETAILEAEGDSIFWYSTEDSEEVIYIGNELTIASLALDSFVYVNDRDYFEFSSDFVGPEDIDLEDDLLYSHNSINASQLFNVDKPMVLKSVKVKTDLPGFRTIELFNKLDELITQKEVMITEGTSRVELDFEIQQPGQGYYLTTNTGQNLINFGFNGPRLWRKNTEISYPYTIDDIVSIYTSDKGTGYFYFFLDWEIQKLPKFCESERLLVAAIVDTSTSIEDVKNINLFKCFPNPVRDELRLTAERNIDNWKIYDVNGLLIKQGGVLNVNGHISMLSMRTGVYMITCLIDEQWTHQKIVKMD